MSASGKRAVPPTAAPGELRTLLPATPLPPLSPAQPATPRQAPIRQATAPMGEVQMQDAGGDDNPSNNDIAVATTPIHTVKTLKIHEPDLYWGDRDKLKGWLYQIKVNIRFQRDRLKYTADQALYASAYCRGKAWDFIKPATVQFFDDIFDPFPASSYQRSFGRACLPYARNILGRVWRPGCDCASLF